MANSYVKRTRWYITWSKLKSFALCEYLYKLKYVDEIDLEEKEARHFVLWTAFHYIMEYGTEKFLEKYYIDEWLVKAKQLKAILEHNKDRDEEQIKEAKKRLLPEIRAEYMRITWNDGKIELTPSEWRDLVWMYEECLKQEIWDMWSEYDKEQRIHVSYRSLQLSWQLDRVSFYDKDKRRYTMQEIDDMLWPLERTDQKKIVNSLWIRGIIRDFKTTRDLERLKKEIEFTGDTKYDYVFSMSFYYTLVYVKYSILSDVYVDAIEKKDPYVSVTIWIPEWMLKDKLREITQLLDRLIDCQKTGEYKLPTREELITNKEIKRYARHIPVKQTEPILIDMMI